MTLPEDKYAKKMFCETVSRILADKFDDYDRDTSEMTEGEIDEYWNELKSLGSRVGFYALQCIEAIGEPFEFLDE